MHFLFHQWKERKHYMNVYSALESAVSCAKPNAY